MFQALYELCQTATLALTISAHEDGRMTVNVVPKPKQDAGEAALAAPLSLTATPEEFDEGFVMALRGYAAKRASLLEQAEATNEVLEAAKRASQDKAAEAARKASKPAAPPAKPARTDDAAAGGDEGSRTAPGTAQPATEDAGSGEPNLFG